MRLNLVAIVLSILFLATGLQAQTTGVPGLNDYTITCVGCSAAISPCWTTGVGGGLGGVSGSTSCTALYFNFSAGGTMTVSVSTTPGAFVTIFGNTCPCLPCFLPLAPVCGLPLTACGGTTTQSVDLDLTCGLNTLFSGFANGLGVYSVSFPVAPLPPSVCITLGTQAAVTGSIACAGPIMVTQAYTVLIG